MLVRTDEPAIWVFSLVVTIVFVGYLLWWVGVPVQEAYDRLRSRLILGVPWGSIIVVCAILAMYLFVQRGWWHWNRPVVVAFTAAWMFDPLGWVLAAFSHASPGHLRSNLITTIVFAPMVEWIWGHYARSDSEHTSLTSRPWVRAFVLFPLGIGIVGITAALFSWGPVIGFSVATYALIGIVLVHAPVLAMVGLVGREIVRLVWRAAADPVQISISTVRVVEPSWFGSAVQGHLVGILLGVLIGLWLRNRLDTTYASPGMVFVATALAGSYLSLWAIWWILGPERYILFRGAGLIVVLSVAAVVTLSIIEKPFYGREIRWYAITIIVIAVVGMGIIGIGLNFATADAPAGDPALIVEDYEIYYGEQIPDGMVNVLDVELLGLTTDVRTSGVVVVSDERKVWRTAVSATELETHGERRFYVGSVGWSEEIVTVRRGWQPLGGDPVYKIWVGQDNGFNVAHTSDAATAQVIVDDHTFTLVPDDDGFVIRIDHAGEVEMVPVPDEDQIVTAQEVEIHRIGGYLVAVSGDTVVPFATQETYE